MVINWSFSYVPTSRTRACFQRVAHQFSEVSRWFRRRWYCLERNEWDWSSAREFLRWTHPVKLWPADNYIGLFHNSVEYLIKIFWTSIQKLINLGHDNTIDQNSTFQIFSDITPIGQWVGSSHETSLHFMSQSYCQKHQCQRWIGAYLLKQPQNAHKTSQMDSVS